MTRFYLRMVLRQWRRGVVRLFCCALIVSFSVTLGISLLVDRMKNLIREQGREVLAADLVLQSSTPLRADQRAFIERVSRRAEVLQFRSMVNHDVSFLLAGIKAVSDSYPLLGELAVSRRLHGEVETVGAGPQRGEVWVEDRVLGELGLTLGEFLMVGQRSFEITRVLIYEPDRGSRFYSFIPRVLMNLGDVSGTGVLKAGSRVKYRYLLSDTVQNLAKLQSELAAGLQANQKFLTIDEANERLSTVLQRAEKFLQISVLVALLLGAIGMSLAGFHYANLLVLDCAILRCLGLGRYRLLLALLLPFFVFSAVSVLLGGVIGVGLHLVLIEYLAEFIPDTLPPPGAMPFLLSLASVGLILVSMVVPFLLNLLRVPAVYLLRRQGTNPIVMRLPFLAVGVGVLGLIYLASSDIWVGVLILLSLIMLAGLIYGFMVGLIKILSKRELPLPFPLVLRLLKANRSMIGLQIVAVATTFFAFALLYSLRDDLWESWQSRVPADAPNFFAFNLSQDDAGALREFIDGNGIGSSPFYPIVRGRLNEINGVAVREHVSKEVGRADHESLNRDLALTWSAALPSDNRIVSGYWHGEDSSQIGRGFQVSVEEQLAEKLGIQVGDRLTYIVGANAFEAEVLSLRSVEWESFTPNFYMMFNSRLPEGLPLTYLASMYITPEQRKLLPIFSRQFPGVTFFDVNFLLRLIRTVMAKVGAMVELILYFSGLAGVIIFIAVELIMRAYRTHASKICRILGASTGLIRRLFLSQYILIGLFSGGAAYVLNVGVVSSITFFLIEGQYIFSPVIAGLCLLVAPCLVIAMGWLSLRHSGVLTGVIK